MISPILIFMSWLLIGFILGGFTVLCLFHRRPAVARKRLCDECPVNTEHLEPVEDSERVPLPMA